MKYLVIISLLVSLLLQTSGQLLVWINYEVHKEYVALNLCENRNKPGLHCHGKCYLKKQIQQQEDAQRKAPLSVLLTKDISETVLPYGHSFKSWLPSLIFSLLSVKISRLPFTSISDIFHPPVAEV